jgi:phospholipid/cholesterol/gamma-HCH transport system permease protein
MKDWLYEIRDAIKAFVRTVGELTLFFFSIAMYTPRTLVKRPGLVVKQVFNSGTMSMTIILTCGLFVGMVLGLQGFDTLQRFGAEEALGTFATLSLVKELGPVLTALLFAGRAGTALASEIGLMRATDQLAAMEMMAVDPVRRIVIPRFLGGVVAMPFLTAIFNMIAIFGAFLVGVTFMGVDQGAFWSQMHANVTVADVSQGVIKSLVFGVVASLLAVYQGYTSVPTAEGVGRATTRTVVTTAITVLILDYLLTATLIG